MATAYQSRWLDLGSNKHLLRDQYNNVRVKTERCAKAKNLKIERITIANEQINVSHAIFPNPRKSREFLPRSHFCFYSISWILVEAWQKAITINLGFQDKTYKIL